MASCVSKVPHLQTFAKKTFSAAATAPKTAGCKGKIDVTTLGNRTIVASMGCEPKSLVKVAVAFRAGSRNESSENFGASHILRSSAGLSTSSASSFYICRNLQQIGATLTATSDREAVVYLLESTSSNINQGLEIMKKAITGQEFRPWELADNIPRIKVELATIPPIAKVIDLIHKAAFRSGLGNSIFVQEYNIKKIGPETLKHYASSNLIGEKAAVAGCGISHSLLASFADSLQLPAGCGSTELLKSKYSGGEIRIDQNIPLAHTIIAAEAPGLNDENALAYAVLRYALGSGPSVKRGIGSGPLSKVSGESANAQALSMAHSDCGLFGIYVSSSGCSAKGAIESAVKALKSGVSEQDVCRGKAQLTSAILYSGETCQGLVEDIVGQAVLLEGTPKSPAELAEAVSRVTTQQVQQALHKVQSGKKSLATIGNITNVPYLDEL